MRLSRGNSDSLSAYLHPPHPPSPRPSSPRLPLPPAPFGETLMDTSEALLAPTWAELQPREAARQLEKGREPRDQSRSLSSPATLCPADAGRVEGPGGKETRTGPGVCGTPGGRPPSDPSTCPLNAPFLNSRRVSYFSETNPPLSSDSRRMLGVPFVGGWTWSPRVLLKRERCAGGSGPPASGRMGLPADQI